MIYPRQYAGRVQVEKDGQQQVVDVPPKSILAVFGPIIEPVIITHPDSVQAELKREGREIPSKTVRALIDTGAESSVITPKWLMS